ncbi:MAG: CPBP family intramembrane glutamic endopeptidase [Armatimonadota bacterium]
MSWHPAIGDYKQQLPRIAVIAAMFAAAAVLIGLHQQRASMPSDRWYRLSRQQVMEADLSWRLGEALDQLGGPVAFGGAETALELRERAVAGWERRTLAQRPSHAAALRLGVVYGHRGYQEHSAEMLALAASLDEDSSDYYHALSDVYSATDLSEEQLREKIAVIASRDGWLLDLALLDAYQRLEDDALLEEVRERRYARAVRFAGGIAGVGIVTGLLFILGVITLALMGFRKGLKVARARAQLPFMVPWTVIDVVEAVAVLLFMMVVGGLLTSLALGRVFSAEDWPLGRPILMGIQYLLVSGVTLAVIWYRIRAKTSHPLRALGVRLKRGLSLVGTGLSGYGAFLTLMIGIALLLGWLMGDAVPLAQTTEEIIGSAETPGEVAIYFVLVCIFAPIFEEIIFRGYVYGGLRRIMSPRAAIIIAAAAFAAVHLNAEAFLVITLIGAMLCYLYERSRSLIPGMIAHGLHNGLVLAVMLIQSA